MGPSPNAFACAALAMISGCTGGERSRSTSGALGDGGADAWVRTEAGMAQADGGCNVGGSPAYQDMTVAARWTTHDLATLDGRLSGFAGAAFDGRYLYLVPFDDGAVDGLTARYDTQAPFGEGGSWALFDTTKVNPSSKGFQGAAFDGQFVYFAPSKNGVVTRYETASPFSSTSSWSTFDSTTVAAAAEGFAGALFDGRFIYFVPNLGRVVTRYDTTVSFAVETSWSTFDLLPSSAGPGSFYGAAFDGRFLYLAPDGSGISARYDTQSDFTLAGSWAVFDLSAATGSPMGFRTAGFDGRYLYLPPSGGAEVAASYDTSGTSPRRARGPRSRRLGESFRGTAFDGRFIYFVPDDGSSLGHRAPRHLGPVHRAHVLRLVRSVQSGCGFGRDARQVRWGGVRRPIPLPRAEERHGHAAVYGPLPAAEPARRAWVVLLIPPPGLTGPPSSNRALPLGGHRPARSCRPRADRSFDLRFQAAAAADPSRAASIARRWATLRRFRRD